MLRFFHEILEDISCVVPHTGTIVLVIFSNSRFYEIEGLVIKPIFHYVLFGGVGADNAIYLALGKFQKKKFTKILNSQKNICTFIKTEPRMFLILIKNPYRK